MNPDQAIVGQIADIIRSRQTFCIVGHVRPDGDCIGSELALAYTLRNAGKDVTVWNADALPDKLAFLDPDRLLRKPRTGQAFDCVITTDAASLERIGRAADCIHDRGEFINIDHHESNTRFAHINWVSPSEPSTGELIYRLIVSLGWPVTPLVADCLFTAISTDTGSFQYPTTRPETYQVAGELVRLGANLGRICNEVYQSYPLSRVRLLRHTYNRFRLTHDDQIAYFWLKRADYQRTGAGPDDSEGLIDHIRAIEPVVVACLFEEIEPTLTRISLRSKTPTIDVNRIANLFGGGGHTAAAGARITGTALSVQRRVISAIRRALDAAA